MVRYNHELWFDAAVNTNRCPDTELQFKQTTKSEYDTTVNVITSEDAQRSSLYKPNVLFISFCNKWRRNKSFLYIRLDLQQVAIKPSEKSGEVVQEDGPGI